MAKAPTVPSMLLWLFEGGLLMHVSLRSVSWVGPCPPLTLSPAQQRLLLFSKGLLGQGVLLKIETLEKIHTKAPCAW